jgi:hypothetical protein
MPTLPPNKDVPDGLAQKLTNINWACEQCAELGSKIARARERIDALYRRLKPGSNVSRIRGQITGQLTDIRWLKQKLADRKITLRLNKGLAEAPNTSEGDFTLTG